MASHVEVTAMSFDEVVRAAAIAEVRQLRDRVGGRIPSASLAEGIVLHGERIPIRNQQKGIFESAALACDGAALSIQTALVCLART